MKEALAQLFQSKKALAAIAATAASTLVVFAGKKGWIIDQASAETLVMAILGLAGTYICGQGAADWGKEKAKIEAAAMTVVETAKKAPEISTTAPVVETKPDEA